MPKMECGPILRRELIVAARRGTTALRTGSAAVVVVIIAALAVAWRVEGRDRSSLSGMSAFALQALGLIVAAHGVLSLMLVPEEVARIVVGARQRKTLDALLTSGLSSAEIVLGALAGGLVRWAACVAGALPAVLLMVPLMGIDPRLVLLAHAGLAAMAFVLAGLALAASVSAREQRAWRFCYCPDSGRRGLAGCWHRRVRCSTAARPGYSRGASAWPDEAGRSRPQRG
jgi:hypothetical protein